MKNSIKVLLVALAIMTYPWTSWAASYTENWEIDWVDPVVYADGTNLPASDIVSHTLKWGTTSGVWPNVLPLGAVTTSTVTQGPGDYYYVVTVTVKNGKESAPSPEFRFTVTDDRQPGGCTISGHKL